MDLYAVSGVAIDNRGYLDHYAAYAEANNDNEAYGAAHQYTLETYPPREGWQHHSTSVSRIPDDVRHGEKPKHCFAW